MPAHVHGSPHTILLGWAHSGTASVTPRARGRAVTGPHSQTSVLCKSLDPESSSVGWKDILPCWWKGTLLSPLGPLLLQPGPLHLKATHAPLSLLWQLQNLFPPREVNSSGLSQSPRTGNHVTLARQKQQQEPPFLADNDKATCLGRRWEPFSHPSFLTVWQMQVHYLHSRFFSTDSVTIQTEADFFYDAETLLNTNGSRSQVFRDIFNVMILSFGLDIMKLSP